MTNKFTRVYALLGPGILFAASAIGVSHLVQSTRAGAMFGLAMIPVLLLACLVKYPSLLFGLLYPAGTGKSLLYSYRAQGWWVVAIYIGLVLYAMWFTLAAVTVTTAGIWQAVVGTPTDIHLASALALFIAVAILLGGRYSGLEHTSKILLGLLAVLLPIATILVVPQVDFSLGQFAAVDWNLTTIAFIIALTGWMPIPVDASVVSSTWATSRNEATGSQTSRADAVFDFNFSYLITAVFAVCFLLLGAGVLHTQGTDLPNGAGPFAATVISLFTSQLGEWSFYLIGTIAFVTLFTTLLTILDGQVRVLIHAASMFGATGKSDTYYRWGLVLFAVGGLVVLKFFMQSFTSFISYATSLGFLLAPAIVVFNHRAMFDRKLNGDLAEEHRPGPVLYWWSVIGGAALWIASATYFYLQWAL